MGFPGGEEWDSKESTCKVVNLGSIPGLRSSTGGRHGNPLQNSCLENPHRQRSLAGYISWGHKESDTTEWVTRHSTAHNIPLYICNTILYPLICRWTSRFLHVLAIVSSAAMNMGVHVSFSVLVSSGYMPGSDIAGSYGGFIPSLKESPYCPPQWLYQFTVPPTVKEVSLFSTPFPAFIVCRLFDNDHSDWYEMISQCSFDLLFSNNEQCWASFHLFVSHLYAKTNFQYNF